MGIYHPYFTDKKPEVRKAKTLPQGCSCDWRQPRLKPDLYMHCGKASITTSVVITKNYYASLLHFPLLIMNRLEHKFASESPAGSNPQSKGAGRSPQVLTNIAPTCPKWFFSSFWLALMKYNECHCLPF